MTFHPSVSLPALTVFAQGLLSFFSPCVLPLLPIYLGYLSGGLGENRSRKRLLLNSAFFVVGISAAFFLLGLGMTAVGRFFSDYQAVFVRIGGVLVILFGLHQLEIIRFGSLERERRVHLDMSGLTMNPLTALVLGFTFSFAWTPCVGPALASVLLMASSADTMAKGLLLIGVYTLGFVLPFLAVALFANGLLNLFRKHRNVMKYTAKVGGALLLVIGIMMVTGWMNGVSSYLSDAGDIAPETGASQQEDATQQEDTVQQEDTIQQEDTVQQEDTQESERELLPAWDFTLVDQYGVTHTLSDYRGKTVLLNFWGTWCGPCRSEMPALQSLYEDWGENSGDLVVLGIARPGLGQEGSVEEITAFLEENGYTYPTVMDEGGTVMSWYGISAFPTTWMIDTEGNLFGYVSGALPREFFDDIVRQTMEGKMDAQ